MKISHLLLSSLGVAVCLAAAGCRDKVVKPEGLPDLYPCVLTFTQAGQPLTEATVQVVSDDAERKWSAGGITDEQGQAILVTYGKFQGVQAGMHTVTVSKQETDVQGVEMEAGIPIPGGTLPKMFTLVEKKFTNPKTTPLKLEITPGANNDQTFECGAPVRQKI